MEQRKSESQETANVTIVAQGALRVRQTSQGKPPTLARSFTMTRSGTLKPEARATGPGRPRRNRQSPESKLIELKRRLREISDINAARALLRWDQATYMPAAGARARARQGAILSRIAHEKRVDARLGKLLDELEPYVKNLSDETDEASLIRVARRDFENAVRVPAEYVTRAAALGSASYDAWTRARPANDFASMIPLLEQALDLSREYAEFFAPYRHVADPLIEDADEGMTTASVRSLFAELRSELLPMVRAVLDQPAMDEGCLEGTFCGSAQLDFGRSVIQQIGYDLDRGRLDETLHPFCTKFSAGDVRITTRVDEADVSQALFSTLHEAGHGLYEQGVGFALEGTPLGWGTSAGVHESQSRLWENVVGRSRGFWEHFYPLLQRSFPHQFRAVELDTFYRAINKVKPSLIRTDADELTYNLHIIMRFNLELALLEGVLAVRDLPEAWRAAMKTDLELVGADDRNGCLQDVHWYAGAVGGGFQGYAIGNILSAQFYAAAVKAQPAIPQEIAVGNFRPLYSWLGQHLYQHGRKFKPDELVERATGGKMSIRPYIAYLRAKYGELYRLPGNV
jgi:carboxypeptidase Taq